MQAVYSNYFTTSESSSKNTLTKHFKQRYVFERSEKRSPYDDSSANSRKNPKNKGPMAGIGYMALTLLLLMVLYPVGLFLLWARRLRWSVAAKLLLTVTTAVIFCALVAFLTNYDTGNPRIESMQNSVKDGLSYINEYTGEGVDAVLGWFADRFDDGIENLEKIWDAADEHVAEKYLSLYDRVDENIKAVKVDLPLMAIQKYRDITDTPYSGGKKANATAEQPVKATEDTPDVKPTATFDPGIMIPSETVEPDVVKPVETVEPATEPEPTVAEPTVEQPTVAEPEPVEMPDIMPVAEATVYFHDNGGKFYHVKETCANMASAAAKHTLKEANDTAKKACPTCKPIQLAALEYTDYLWLDTESSTAHTTLNCEAFTGKSDVKTMAEINSGSFTYCAECKADIVHELKGRVVSTSAAGGAYKLNTPTVSLPKIKDVSLAPVFFTNGGTWYHATSNCQKMMNAVSHTLGEAKNANKLSCDVCGVIPLSMLDSEHYLWLDVAHTAHTTDECRLFAQGKYTVLPYEDIYGKNYPFCAACGAKDCLAYIEQNRLQFTINSEGIDEATLALYDYEKTITVYYGDNSRKYHSSPDCMYMNDAKYIKTLYMALHVDNKQRCSICSAVTEEDAMRQMSAGM